MQEQARGKVDQVIGKLRETAGKLTGDRSAEIGGKAQQIKGKAEEKIGDLERLIDDLERSIEWAAGGLRPQAHQSTGQFSKMRLFRNGLIQRERAYFDLAGLMRQLGIAQPKS